jgi:hypothetical protein
VDQDLPAATPPAVQPATPSASGHTPIARAVAPMIMMDPGTVIEAVALLVAIPGSGAR